MNAVLPGSCKMMIDRKKYQSYGQATTVTRTAKSDLQKPPMLREVA
jgi:hypothetical protein